MLITLKTNLPETPRTLHDVKEIIKFAKLVLDVNLEIKSYGEITDLQLSAINNGILETILEEM